jgi:hypothetical protein
VITSAIFALNHPHDICELLDVRANGSARADPKWLYNVPGFAKRKPDPRALPTILPLDDIGGTVPDSIVPICGEISKELFVEEISDPEV